MTTQLFFAKILLFGEYGIIKNSNGISIPFNSYKGNLKIGDLKNDEINKSNFEINNFYNYLHKSVLKDNINIKQFKSDLNEGLFFDSSIPKGYGIGSSGALVAALYDRYFIKKISKDENLDSNKILELKKVFSEMESFFHGKSSGLDPLNSYLCSSILINSNNDIKVTTIPKENLISQRGFFIIDSGLSSETQELVNFFLELMKNNDFKIIFQNEFIRVTNLCVENFLNSDFESLFKNFKILSRFVFDNLSQTIPEGFQSIWEKGLISDNYYLKLCGSGGGGYILGFSKDLVLANKIFLKNNFKVIYRC